MFFLKFIGFTIIVFVVFSLPKLRTRKQGSRYYLFLLPVGAGLLLAFLSVVKLFFMYKLAIIVFCLLVGTLTVWAAKSYLKK